MEGMHPFSTLLIYQCPANINRRRVESGKQPTSGSNTQTEPVPIPEKLTIKGVNGTNGADQSWIRHQQILGKEWYERTMLQPVTATKNICCECYEWTKPYLKSVPAKKYREWTNERRNPVPVNEHYEWCEWKPITSEPVQATPNKCCELYEWDQPIHQVFLSKITVFLNQATIATEPVPETTSHISELPSPSQSHRANSKRKNYQTGRTRERKQISYSGRRWSFTNISQREDVGIPNSVVRCLMNLAPGKSHCTE